MGGRSLLFLNLNGVVSGRATRWTCCVDIFSAGGVGVDIIQRVVGGISSSISIDLDVCSEAFVILPGRKRPFGCRGGAAFRSLFGIGLPFRRCLLRS